MNILRVWLRRVWYLVNRSRMDRELQKEMETHRSMMGAPSEFGNVFRLREQARDAWGWNGIDALWRDLSYAIRGLRRETTFAVTVTLTLALGIATITTVFSVVDSELWRPLPFPHPEQLVAIYSRGPGDRAIVDGISGAELQDWRAGTPALADLAAAGRTSRRSLRLETSVSVLVTEVTANYLSTLGRNAISGGMPSISDAQAARTAFLTDRVWQRIFNADPSIVGRAVTLDNEKAVIGGVVPADDSLGPDSDLFLLVDETAASFLDGSRPMFYGAVGRLQPGVDAAVALAQLQAIESRLQTGSGNRAGHIMHVEDLGEYFRVSSNWRPLYFFLGASFLVLLLSTMNVATLLLARAFRRTREFALRGALGGSHGALVRQLLVEGGLLAMCGAALGAIMTLWAVEFFTAQLPADFLFRGQSIPIDSRIGAFVFLVTGLIMAGLVLTPLLALRRSDLSCLLGSGARTGRPAAEGKWRIVLLTAQIALTVMLLSGAGIFVKSFIAMTNIPLGFDPADTVALRVNLSGPRFASDYAIRAYADQLLEGARAIPGVQLAAIGTSSPLGSGPMVTFAVAGEPSTSGNAPRAILRSIGPDYFQTLGIRILQGREFGATDVPGAPRVAVVNESLVRQKLGGANPIGRVIDLLPGARTPWTNKPGALLIVGVASNVKEVGLNEVEFADIYVPFAQTPAPWVELIARSAVPSATVVAPLREHAARVDPAVPVTGPSTFEHRVATALQGDRFNLLLISGFAGVALLLAAVGIYGAVTYNVQQRTRELGVRLALGARPMSLVAVVVWQAARFGIVGGTLGVAGSLGLAAIIGNALYLVPGSHNGLLFGVTTTDPWILGAAFFGIVFLAVIAASIPARRVPRVDPVLALRNE